MQKDIFIVPLGLVPVKINFLSSTHFVSYPHLVLAFILRLPGLTPFAKIDLLTVATVNLIFIYVCVDVKR